MFLLCFLMAATQIIKSQLINKQAQQILEDRKVNIKRTGRCAPEGQHSSSCAGSLQHCSVTPNNHNLSPGNLNASLTPGSIKANLLLCNFNLTESATDLAATRHIILILFHTGVKGDASVSGVGPFSSSISGSIASLGSLITPLHKTWTVRRMSTSSFS